ncbi:hypothetical protein [Niastella populi]|uniref:Uncharacterized protein n=1 Tax=Niastella populi TaxID=550983 RepID=A0A1V9GDH0_9BACT|nr:hypothetical protein [Niastella populi]OQP68592.1 hypothetical protein A4R26_01985 [Niastella populi]
MMKKILIPILLFAGIVGYVSCQKERSSDPHPVAAEKTEGIKKGEPVLFSVENYSGQTAKWNVSPASNVQLTSDGNIAKILFGRAGAYQITATTGGTVARITVNVSDSIYCDSTGHCYDSTWNCHDSTGIDTCRFGNCLPKDTIPHDTIPRDSIYSLHGDQIHITPVKIDSGNVSGLLIKATTGNSYPCTNNYLLTNVIIGGVDSSGYIFKYPGVQIPRNCNGGQVPATSVRAIMPVQNGNHVFKVVVNGITYTGSFTKTGNQYSFNWPYTSGVTISPLTIN